MFQDAVDQSFTPATVSATRRTDSNQLLPHAHLHDVQHVAVHSCSARRWSRVLLVCLETDNDRRR